MPCATLWNPHLVLSLSLDILDIGIRSEWQVEVPHGATMRGHLRRQLPALLKLRTAPPHLMNWRSCHVCTWRFDVSFYLQTARWHVHLETKHVRTCHNLSIQFRKSPRLHPRFLPKSMWRLRGWGKSGHSHGRSFACKLVQVDENICKFDSRFWNFVNFHARAQLVEVCAARALGLEWGVPGEWSVSCKLCIFLVYPRLMTYTIWSCYISSPFSSPFCDTYGGWVSMSLRFLQLNENQMLLQVSEAFENHLGHFGYKPGSLILSLKPFHKRKWP